MGFLDNIFKPTEQRSYDNSDGISAKDTSKRNSDLDVVFKSQNSLDVNEENVLKIPATEACVNVISKTIAQIPIELYRINSDDSVTKIKFDNRVALLNDEPNEMMSGYDFKRRIVKDYLLHGGAYIKPRYKGRKYEKNKIEALDYLDNEKITFTESIKVTDDGIAIKNYEMLYQTYFEEGFLKSSYKPIKLNRLDVISILNDSKDNRRGQGALKKGEKIFKQALKQLQYSNAYLNNAITPNGKWTINSDVDDERFEEIKKKIHEQSGALSAGKDIVVSGDIDYQLLGAGISPTDMNLLEAIRSTNSEICKLFGVPENMIGVKQDAQYQSTDANNRSFITFALNAIPAIESALNKSLLSEREKEAGYYFRFNTSELKRTAEKDQVETLVLGLKHGLFTVDEARARLDLPPIPKEEHLPLKANGADTVAEEESLE